MNYKSLRKQILSNPQVRKERGKSKLAFAIAEMVMDARIKRKMSQKELAKRVGTQQPSIARIESGDSLPSLRLLKKVADALGTEIRVRFSKEEQYLPPGIPYHIFWFDASSTGDERERKISESYDLDIKFAFPAKKTPGSNKS